MEKKGYISPETLVVTIEQSVNILAGSQGDSTHSDDPRHPGEAMSRRERRKAWDDWEDEEEEDF